MTRDELIELLRALAAMDDSETAHARADDALIVFIGDEEIAEVYGAVGKWYA